MMWVVRAGKRSVYFDKYMKTSRIYIPWDGFRVDLSKLERFSKNREKSG